MKNMFGRKFKNYDIDPDEVFLDSRNLASFDTARFEGTIERALSKRSVAFIAIIFALLGLVFLIKITSLQVVRGEVFAKLSADNNLESILVTADRGIIYDRNDKLMAWNDVDGKRVYAKDAGISHVVGYVGFPKQVDDTLYSNEKIGITGIEKKYEERLRGEHGEKIEERHVSGEIISESIQSYPVPGTSLKTTIDLDIEKAAIDAIKSAVDRLGYVGGGFAMMDIDNGEMIALVSYPDFDPNVMSEGVDYAQISQYLGNKKNPFLNRITSGLYAPGSTIKPYVATAALQEGVITENTEILSTGSIVIPNPFFPDLSAVFVEANNRAHGNINVKEALAVSSNVFFYEVSGGYKSQKGIGIRVLKDYLEKFGFGSPVNLLSDAEPAGTLPSPEWKAENFKGEAWQLGDTYHTAIGQYGLLITPMQILRAVGAIANGGELVTPKLLKTEQTVKKKIPVNEKYFKPVKEGMRGGVLNGTVWRLNFDELHIAGKTGTAEVGVNNSFINSWVTGFFPYENPKYAFVLVMERGVNTGENGASTAASDFFAWLIGNKKEFLASPKAID